MSNFRHFPVAYTGTWRNDNNNNNTQHQKKVRMNDEFWNFKCFYTLCLVNLLCLLSKSGISNVL